MDSEEVSLRLALTAFQVLKSPGKIAQALVNGGRDALFECIDRLDQAGREYVVEKAAEMQRAGINVLLAGDQGFPPSLIVGKKPIVPMIFYRGNPNLLMAPSVGMCGSRSVSAIGLDAAVSCGTEATRLGLAVVSGYAKGVDTATHLAALRSGGSTVIVLAEGFDHFRVKREFAELFDYTHTLVISQFPPSQPWKAFGAMARNALIYGLSKSLVVVEAGDKGGTLAAGEGAMKLGRPVIVLEFGNATPPGNIKLLSRGAHPVSSVDELSKALRGIPRQPEGQLEPKLF